ncbi:hypothetical protein Tco_0786822 [Tanacetum coccineum]
MAQTMTMCNAGRRTPATQGVNEVPGFATVIAKQLQDLLPTIVAQVGDHVSNQGNIESQNDNATDDNIHEDDRNANLGNCRNECSYKDFVACKPKEFDGKDGMVAYIHWVEKMEAVHDISRMVAYILMHQPTALLIWFRVIFNLKATIIRAEF